MAGEAAQRYPPDVTFTVYDEKLDPDQDRINLLLQERAQRPGAGRGDPVPVPQRTVAFWVTVGIPVSFMATLAIVYVAGGSINMISMFA